MSAPSQTTAASSAADEDEVPDKQPGCLYRAVRYVVLATLISAVIVLVDALRVKLPVGTPGTPAIGEQIGVIHVHTKFSGDSNGEIEDVVSAARWAELSFVAITDHDEALDKKWAGKQTQGVLVLGGEEVSTADGHFVALGVLPGWRDGVAKDSESLMRAARKAGGAVFIAHPFGTRRDWTNWNVKSYDGIEIWNGDAEWRDEMPWALAMGALTYTVNPDLAMVRMIDRPEKNLAKWDELLQKRPVAGVCGSDAHANIPFYGFAVKVPAYLRVFRLMREHVLLGPDAADGTPAPRDAKAIVRALKLGHSFCAVDDLSVASGFVSRVEGEGAIAGPGQSIPWSPGTALRVTIPPGSGRPMIKVFKDGIETFNVRGWRLDADVPGPGRYRTEVWLRQPGLTGGQSWAPWILSNPIYVTGGVVPATDFRDDLDLDLPAESPAPTPAAGATAAPAASHAP